METVQVVVPCYNYGRYLEACVGSVLAQEGVELDVLVIDDCSSDDTPEICRSLAVRHRQVRVIRHEANRGHVATFNEGISLIRGDYFVLLSADDLLAAGALARATALMRENPSVGMVYGQAISLRGEILPPPRTGGSGYSIWPGREWIRLVCKSSRNFVMCPEAVIRTSVQRRLGGYDPALPHSGDLEMWLRAAAISDIGRLHGVDQAYYRVHPASMQHTTYAGSLADLVGRRDAFQSAFLKEAGQLRDWESLHMLARRALAKSALRRACDIQELENGDRRLIDDHCGFARSLMPNIVHHRRWRALQEANGGGVVRRRLRRLGAQIRRRFDRTFVDRLRWRWARRTGVYLPG
jgi:glycosyltransferase involved in cell wall biosynthesis